MTRARGAERRLRRRRRRLVALAIVVLCVLVTVDVEVATDDHRDHVDLANSVRRLQVTHTELGTTWAAVVADQTTRTRRQAAIDETEEEIATVEQNIRQAATTGALQSIDIGTLSACLNGVATAQSDIAGGNLPGAVATITAVSAACLTVDGNSSGLAYPFDFPDPFVLPVNGRYYAFATNAAAGNIQVVASPDLVHWTTIGDALPHLPAWAAPTTTVWAPSVLPVWGGYVLYYAASDAAVHEQCISAAVATQPQGPYVDASTGPLECQPQLGGSIDPSTFVDTNGNIYLQWKSQGAGTQLPTLWAQQLQPWGTSLVAGNPSPLLEPDQEWEHGYLEAPDMVLSAGHYVLLYSGSDWKTATYAMGAADCDGPLGPCTDVSAQPILASGPGFAGPGGGSVFTDGQGRLWLAFDAWLPGEVGEPHSRPFFIRPLSITGGVPVVGP